MRLIATLGTTPARHRHRYFIEGRFYDSLFSFEALKEHYGLGDDEVIIVGTVQTRRQQAAHIEKYRFVEIDAEDMDDIFAKITQTIGSDDLVDLTQSFRSISLGAMLSLGFSKALGKEARQIYYAQAREGCNAAHEECDFDFVSLRRYEEIVDMARMINTFVGTLIVLEQEITDEKIRSFSRKLKKVSEDFLNNNYVDLFDSVSQVLKSIESLRNDKEYDFLHSHLERLAAELKAIASLKKDRESEQLLEISEYLWAKRLYLHSVTTLYESMTAFLDEEIDEERCKKIKTRSGKRRTATTYERRNCLKKLKTKKIPHASAFDKILQNIDKLRNISAHAFTSDKTSKKIPNEIEKAIEELKKIYARRYSGKSGIERLKAGFSDR